MRIELGTCTIRPWTRHDRADLILHANDRRIWRNLGDVFPHPYTERDADAWLDRLERETPVTNFAIDVDGAAIGGIGFEVLPDVGRRTAEFGYWLGTRHWGRGIATEAARAFVARVFESHPLVRMQASVFEWNPASMRVLEKIGCVREGILRRSVFKDGQVIDRHLYAITREP